jgi:diguanylate cyclase (GGDEF)-like protein
MYNSTQVSFIDELIKKLDELRYVSSQETLELGNKVYSLSKEAKYSFGMAIALLRISEAYTYTGKYEEAINAAFESMEYFYNEGIGDLEASAYVILGVIFCDLADYEKSIEFYQTAERVVEQLDENKRYNKNNNKDSIMSVILNNQGEIYKLQKDYNEAYACYVKAEELDSRRNYNALRGISLLNLGEIYYLLNNYEQAIHFINKSIICMETYNNKLDQYEAFRVLALIYWKKRELGEAEKFFKKSTEADENELTPYYHLEGLISYSEYLDSNGDINDAIEALEKAFSLSIDNELLEKTPIISGLLGELYEKAKDSENALRYYKIHLESEKKLNVSLAKQRVKALRARKKLEVIERERKEMLEKNERLKRKSEELQQIINNISIISELGQKVTSDLDLDRVAFILYKSIGNFISFDALSIGLYDNEKELLYNIRHIKDNYMLNVSDIPLDAASSLEAYCIRNRELVVVNDLEEKAEKYIGKEQRNKEDYGLHEINSFIYCPLIINDAVIGLIRVQEKRKNVFTTYHIEMLKALSAYAAIAVNNSMKSMCLAHEVERRRTTQIELEKANEKLLYISENDGLTEIPNRRKFDRYMNKLWDRKKERPINIALILLDIDCFKEYNDNYGHVEGDRCILMVAQELASRIHGNWLAARYGGDEFVIVMPETTLDKAVNFGEQLRRGIESLGLKHEYSRVSDVVTVTLGAVCITSENDITINEFVRKADNALYKAKQRGRNQITGVQL